MVSPLSADDSSPCLRQVGSHPLDPSQTLPSGRYLPSGHNEFEASTAFLPMIPPGRITQLSATFDPAHKITFAHISFVVNKIVDLDPNTTSSPISSKSNSPEIAGC